MVSLVPADTEVLAGLELGGVPVATALSLATGLPTAFVRKEAKSYGTAELAEGAERGAMVREVLCVIDRSDGDHSRLDEMSLGLRSLFTRSDLEG